MKNLLKNIYIPFGSQYYRAPSPHKAEWERDLTRMAQLGFNTVKFWVQWRWNNPDSDVYYWDDIDELMDLAEKNKLRVMLNTIFDVAPAWIYKKFPDASMITLSGRKIGPQTQPHRQIGGLGYCFNHTGVSEYFFRFLEETIKRYKKHPALEIWNVGSEPELTSSMAEMRAYADDASKIGDMLCYCSNCQKKFKSWLHEKYQDIGSLNNSWNRNYKSFDEAEVPLTRNTFNDIIDWRMFFVHTLEENVKKRFETAAAIDEGLHPLMCHHVFIQGFPVTSTANDPWNVGKFGDLHGFTQMDDMAMIDILRSCAKDKPVISAEMLMLPGYTLDLPDPIDNNDVKKFVFSGIAGNQKGFIFWQYRPEILGREAPTWGLTYPDGEETPWLNAFSETGKVLQKNADFILSATPQKADIAMLYDPKNQIFSWASTGNEKTATDSLLGFHRALYERNFIIDFLHPDEFESGILANYKVLVIPFPYLIDSRVAYKLKKWVEEGGVLICESYAAGWDYDNGHHSKVIPGFGLDEIFKVKQSVVASAPRDGLFIKMKKDIPYVQSGAVIKGFLVKETYFNNGAEELAFFESGEPAVFAANYGKGKAVIIGSYTAVVYHRENYQENGNLLAGIVEKFSGISKPSIDSLSRIRVDVLSYKKEKMIILRNLEPEIQEITVTLPGESITLLTEQFTDDKIVCSKHIDGVSFKVKLDEKEVKVYRG